jgi:hypothetical protein
MKISKIPKTRMMMRKELLLPVLLAAGAPARIICVVVPIEGHPSD